MLNNAKDLHALADQLPNANGNDLSSLLTGLSTVLRNLSAEEKAALTIPADLTPHIDNLLQLVHHSPAEEVVQQIELGKITLALELNEVANSQQTAQNAVDMMAIPADHSEDNSADDWLLEEASAVLTELAATPDSRPNSKPGSGANTPSGSNSGSDSGSNTPSVSGSGSGSGSGSSSTDYGSSPEEDAEYAAHITTATLIQVGKQLAAEAQTAAYKEKIKKLLNERKYAANPETRAQAEAELNILLVERIKGSLTASISDKELALLNQLPFNKLRILSKYRMDLDEILLDKRLSLNEICQLNYILLKGFLNINFDFFSNIHYLPKLETLSFELRKTILTIYRFNRPRTNFVKTLLKENTISIHQLLNIAPESLLSKDKFNEEEQKKLLNQLRFGKLAQLLNEDNQLYRDPYATYFFFQQLGFSQQQLKAADTDLLAQLKTLLTHPEHEAQLATWDQLARLLPLPDATVALFDGLSSEQRRLFASRSIAIARFCNEADAKLADLASLNPAVLAELLDHQTKTLNIIKKTPITFYGLSHLKPDLRSAIFNTPKVSSFINQLKLTEASLKEMTSTEWSFLNANSAVMTQVAPKNPAVAQLTHSWPKWQTYILFSHRNAFEALAAYSFILPPTLPRENKKEKLFPILFSLEPNRFQLFVKAGVPIAALLAKQAPTQQEALYKQLLAFFQLAPLGALNDFREKITSQRAELIKQALTEMPVFLKRYRDEQPVRTAALNEAHVQASMFIAHERKLETVHGEMLAQHRHKMKALSKPFLSDDAGPKSQVASTGVKTPVSDPKRFSNRLK